MISLVAGALSAAQMAATLARADQGAGSAELRFYATTMPSTAGPHADSPMCVIQLAKPCAEISAAGVLSFIAVGPGMVTVGGIPRWCEWLAGDGAQLHLGDVTDEANGGFYKVAGAATPVGETSPLFFAGAMMSLGVSELT